MRHFFPAAFIYFLVTPALVFAQDAENQASENEADIPTEIVVNAPVSLKFLRSEIDKAQDAMFDRFNDFNDDDRFDIHCRQIRRTGTRLLTRECSANFFREAQEGEADLFMKQIGIVGEVAPGPGQEILARDNKILKEKMTSLCSSLHGTGFRILLSKQ